MSARSGTEHRQRTAQVGVRLLPDERAILERDADAQGVSMGELLRRAYFSSGASR